MLFGLKCNRIFFNRLDNRGYRNGFLYADRVFSITYRSKYRKKFLIFDYIEAFKMGIYFL